MTAPMRLRLTRLPAWVEFPHRSWRPLNEERTYWECADCGCRRLDAMTKDGAVYEPRRPGAPVLVMGSPPICRRRRRKRVAMGDAP